MQNLCACAQEISEKNDQTHVDTRAPGRSSNKDNGIHAPTQLRLARTKGTHDTHETKTKTKRNRSHGYKGRTSRTNSPKPPLYTYNIYIYIYTYTCKNAYTPIKIPLGEGSDISIQEATEVCLIWGRTERTKKESNKTEPPPKKSVLGPHHN